MALTTDIDSVDNSAYIRLQNFVVVEMAYGGEVGIGGFTRDDLALGDVPAMKMVTVDESAASPTRLFTGYTSVRSLDRGVVGRVENRRQWDVTVLDGNTILDDEVFQTDGANRPAETDYARITWLLTTGAMSALGVTAGVVPNTNTVNMDATDYRHRGPRDVLSDCAEQASKNYFIYDYTGGGWLLYYDLATGTSLTSTLSLSSVATEVDSSTVFATMQPRLSKDPSRIYSAVDFAYANGYVFVEDAGTEATYRRREVAIGNTDVKTSTAATNRANAYLAKVGTELETFLVSVQLPKDKVNLIRAGQRIPVHVPHLNINSNTYFRISRREVTPLSSEQYQLNLEFAENLLPARFGSGTPGDTGGTVADDATVALTRYQLIEEIGGGPFGPAAGLWDTISPSFAFGSSPSTTTSKVDKEPSHNVPWPYTDCGIGLGASGGLAIYEAWYRFTADLDVAGLVGIHVTVDDLSGTATGFAIGDGTLTVGMHTGTSSSAAEVTAHGDFTEVGTVGSGGGEVFIPRSLLLDNGTGYCWIVVAANWEISSDLLICVGDTKPAGYVELGASSGGDAPVLIHAVTSVVSGVGLSPWLPADGDVDGSNTVFSLPVWNGTGVPEVRVGVAILGAGEYSYDAGALTVTLSEAPPVEMAGQVAYRAQMG